MFAAADASAHAAIAYHGEGLRGAALTAAGRAQRLAYECGAVSPALREAAQPLPLTPREQEIISLVAQGLSNREIAHALALTGLQALRALHPVVVRGGCQLLQGVLVDLDVDGGGPEQRRCPTPPTYGATRRLTLPPLRRERRHG